MEDSGGRGAASTGTGTQTPQDPRREEQVRRKRGLGRRSFLSLDAEGVAVQEPRGEGSCAASCAATWSPQRGCARGCRDSLSGLWGRGAARSCLCLCSAPTGFPRRPHAVRVPGASAWAALALPPLWPCGAPPTSARGSHVCPVSATASWGVRCRSPRICRSLRAGRPWSQDRSLHTQEHRVAFHPCASSSISVPSVLSSERRLVTSLLRFPPGHFVPPDAVVNGTVSSFRFPMGRHECVDVHVVFVY